MERLTALLREALVPLADGTHAYLQDQGTLQDALDLYSVLSEQHTTGSPNLENEQARGFVETLQQGAFLDETQLVRLLELLAKYADEIDELRQSPDRDGQDFLHVPDPARPRIIEEP